MSAPDQHDPSVSGTSGETSGDMGVSSQRIGDVGGGRLAPSGTRDTALVRAADAPAHRERDVQPDYPSLPVAGYPKIDPRSKLHRYQPR
jgi:hypothetical protein